MYAKLAHNFNARKLAAHFGKKHGVRPGPLIAIIDDAAPVYLPGAAFFFSSALVFIGMLLAVRSFRRNGFRDMP